MMRFRTAQSATRIGAARPLVRKAEEAGDSSRSRLRSVAKPPSPTPDRACELAEAMAAEERIFRRLMFAIPATAERALEAWRERTRQGRDTAALCSGYRDNSGRNWRLHIDSSMREIEKRVAERARAERSRHPEAKHRVAKLDQEIGARLEGAEVALPVVLAIFRELHGLAAGSHPGSPEVLSPADRDRLARAQSAIDGLQKARHAFITSNLGLVADIAKSYCGLGVPSPDLMQEGTVGLMRAVEKFDHHLGFRFSTYAVWWIHQAVIRAIQTQSRTVRVPSHIWQLQGRYRRAERELRQRLRRPPDREELAAALGLTPGCVDRVAASMSPIASIHAPIPEAEDASIEPEPAAEDVVDPVDCIDRAEIQGMLERAITALGWRERSVLEYHYGLNGQAPLTLAAIGRRLGLSRERVRQIEVRALARLRREDPIRRLAGSIDLPLPRARRRDDDEADLPARKGAAGVDGFPPIESPELRVSGTRSR